MEFGIFYDAYYDYYDYLIKRCIVTNLAVRFIA